MTCEHEFYEMIGNFPENMEVSKAGLDMVEDEYMTNKIECMECGKIGTEYYKFVERKFEE